MNAIILLLFYISILVAGIGGYISNIVKLLSGMDTISVTELVVRCVGIIAAPFGAVAGYF